MNSWRPDNWKELQEKNNIYPEAAFQKYHFEAGADAILEALRGIHSLEGTEKMLEFILKPDTGEASDE